MSFSRSLSKFLSSSNPQKWSLLRSSSFCTRTPSPIKRPNKRNPKSSTSNFPKPSEIPYQPKVANSVHLVGSIGVPVQLQTLPSGVYAVSVLVQGTKKNDSPQLCIPVIFHGDLAQIAACHLKESDLVYVTGQLSGAALPQTVEDKSERTVEDAETHIQVVADSLNFVQKTYSEKESEMLYDQDDIASDCSGVRKKIGEDQENLPHGSASARLAVSSEVEESPSNLHLWSDFFAHPDNWWDNRSSESNPAHAAFKHKKSGQTLWINDSTPEWVLSKLDMQSFRQTRSSKNETVVCAKSSWNDLVDNPQQWLDYRGDKLKELLSRKHPDFKQKGTGKALWLDTAPDWVLLKLSGLEFCGSNKTTNNEKENLWRNLVENPNKWWDNRSKKLKPNSPDFKHKDTGEALWIGSHTPPWVLPKLPPLCTKKDV